MAIRHICNTLCCMICGLPCEAGRARRVRVALKLGAIELDDVVAAAVVLHRLLLELIQVSERFHGQPVPLPM